MSRISSAPDGQLGVISAEAVLDGKGILRELKVSGHSEIGQRGENLLCAAVSVLTRTAFETLASRDDMIVSGNAASPGNLEFSVKAVPEDCESWSLGVTDSLLIGLSSLEREYPGQMAIRIQKNWRK